MYQSLNPCAEIEQEPHELQLVLPWMQIAMENSFRISQGMAHYTPVEYEGRMKDLFEQFPEDHWYKIECKKSNRPDPWNACFDVPASLNRGTY